jgi:hypothetical protein
MAVVAGDPYLDAGVRGHIVRLAQANKYKLAGWDVEDLIQEGYLCYALVKTRYVGARPKRRPDGTLRRSLPPKRPDQIAKRHFMRLFQRTFNNRISTLVRKQSRLKELLLNDLISAERTEESAWDQIMQPEDEQATMLTLLRSAPTEIRQLFALMVDDATRPMRRFGKRRRPARETTNEYYCRLLGLPRGTDLTGLVQKYFVG